MRIIRQWFNWLKLPDRKNYYNPLGWDMFKLVLNRWQMIINGGLSEK